MAYDDFLQGFAKAQNLESVEVLLSDYATQYSFQIRSRERAKLFIAQLQSDLDYDFVGKKVLDVGCAYGSFSIELSLLGAQVTGIDVSEKWLRLAALNAINEADVRFLLEDASSRSVLERLGSEQFDLIIMNDVLEHIYDTAGLLHNCRELLTENGLLYFKVPNGMATSNVLSEGHKKVFAISLLAPDFWPMFVKAPFRIYYRRLEFYEAMFSRFGLRVSHWITANRDSRIEVTRRLIVAGTEKIKHRLAEPFESTQQHDAASTAVEGYVRELDQDLDTYSHADLFLKYRATFWEGVIVKTDSVAAHNRSLITATQPLGLRVWQWVDARFPIATGLVRDLLKR